ncbi:uncharacterized protein N7511_001391 [Penicillium nucicola]|uniref:uncharacterized protein n=1 Tax=Penicillium nucicola TaxID=1850975 RepID=UPI002545A086|nr:uncharacterized protein N7511_001391 [Penicillium nucicola]KAJ5776380.1 hypothetical protein N7511_001391 [Penicillium nucicola]
METITHHAPSLNASLIGESDDNLALFRGVPYASVKERWTHSEVTNTLDSPFNATNFGPRCPQGEGMVLVTGGVTDPAPGDDEFKCLNLNICVPKEALSNTSGPGLPVIVWIHGGGFLYGANSVSRYRAQAFTNHAAETGHPIILVQINYRLGVLGFAASSDLASTASDSTLPNNNWGLVDQHNALEWVNKHIASFGGDRNNITAMGVSAGSASIHFHMLSRLNGSPLFDRAIMMSGSASTLGPLPFEVYEREWGKCVGKCGISDNSSEEVIRQMRGLDVDTLIGNYSKAALGPVGDGGVMPTAWRFGDGYGRETGSRCKEIILGDTNVEALILDAIPENISQEKFAEMIDGAFSDDLIRDDFRKAFGFRTQTQPFEEYRNAVRLLLGSTMFQYPNIGIARAGLEPESVGRDVYLYHFEEPSPFPGPTEGMSYHGLCALLIYLNQLDGLSEEVKRTSLEAAGTFAAFAYGKKPWESFGEAGRFMRLGPKGVSGMHDFKSDQSRGYGHLQWMDDHFEETKEFVWSILLA